jgi:uncharacterized protein (TIGR04255 family)
MEQATHYSRSPIIEARIEIKVKLSPETEVTNLMQIASEIESEYEIEHQYFNINGQITVDSDLIVSASANNSPAGYSFLAENKQRRIQARLDGFTFSQSTPYSGWVDFQETARNLWEIYDRATNPIEIERLALRYINRIEIPSTNVSLKDYFTNFPEISPDLQKTLGTYIMHLQIPIEDVNSVAHITQARVPPDSFSLDTLFIILDINIITEGTISIQAEDIWKQFNLMHQNSGRIFELFITDKTRESIQ